ncbi:MAG TPA: hypothetical protein PKJ99_11485 [Thermoanaerobaculales bacterium]|nr:hypothetical protein [Thermoanaerobaculales bacterium]HQL30620.1 hypothetical protein [Thermoanaerobaculales bacterium]
MNAARTVVSVLLVAGAMLPARTPPAADCLRQVGELPEGPALAVDMHGNVAAFGRGRVLVLVDLADPSNPVELGSVVLPGVVGSVELTATHAWVAAGPAGLIGVAVTDPRLPEVVSVQPASPAGEEWVAVDVDVAEGVAYLSESVVRPWGQYTRLRIVDVSVPDAPADIGSYWAQGQTYASVVIAVNGLVLLGASNDLIVVDVSTPEHPRAIGRYTMYGDPRDAVVSGETVFALDGGGVEVLNISDPSHPVSAAYLPTGSRGAALALEGDLLIVGGPDWYEWGDPFGAWIYDVSPPWLPTQLGFVETPAPVAGLAADGGLMLAAAGSAGLRVIDFSRPTQPVEMAALAARGSIRWAEAEGDLAVAGSSHQMTVVDVSNAAHPVELGELPLSFWPTEYPAELEGSLAFVGSYLPPGVAVFDVSSPAAPVMLSFLVLEHRPAGLDASGPKLYAAVETELVVIDIADPWSPEIIGQAPAGEGGAAMLVAADGGFVTVANSHCPWFPGCYPTIERFDVVSPELPVLTDTLYDAIATAIAPSGELPFVAGGSRQTPGGVVVIDTSNPMWLRVVGGLDLDTHPTSIEVGNGVAYVLTDPPLATPWVQMVSLRDPLHPWLIGEHPTLGEALDVALSGNLLLVADGDAGLLLLDATECAFPPPRHPGGRLVPNP